MKNLLLGTALALVTAWPAISQTTTGDAATAQADANQTATVAVIFLPDIPNPVFASDLIGMRVYSSESDYSGYNDEQMVARADRDTWDDVGEINDIVMSTDGGVQGVLVDVGGFLGIGERTVALDMKQVNFLRDDGGDRFIAVNSTREELENAPAYERPMMDETAAAGMGDTTVGMPATNMPAAGLTPAAETDEVRAMARPAFQREGFADVDYGALTAEDLDDAEVYDGNDENVGEIEMLTVGADGSIDKAVIDVGGFLGLGERRVAIDYDQLQVMRDGGGLGGVRVYVDQTREALEQMPIYED